MSEYITIKKNITHEITIKKSRFITNLIRVNSEEQAQEKLQEIKKIHYKANHNCSAYIIGKINNIERMSDDGEPAGTAGIPILGVLKNKEITNTLAIVTRYFGGIKLGKGGLIRAYSHAVSEALPDEELVEAIILRGISFLVPYNQIDIFKYELEQLKIDVADITYTEQVEIKIYIPETEVTQILSNLNTKLNGNLTYALLNTELREVPLNKKTS